MKHNLVIELYNYWTRMRGVRNAPERGEIEPHDISAILPHAFLIECDKLEGYSARISGTEACTLFMKDLKGKDFLSLFEKESFETLNQAFHHLHNDCSGIHINWKGRSTRYHDASGEMLALPLQRKGVIDRAICIFVSDEELYWKGSFPLCGVRVDTIRMMPPSNRDALVLNTPFSRPLRDNRQVSSVPVQRVKHLAVYEGGGNRKIS